MKTSIVIATFNKLAYTQQCIESIRAYTPADSYEIIVVDNNSSDDTPSWLAAQEDIVLIGNKENLGFPKACNQGIEVSTGDNILLLNNDTVVGPRWLENMEICLYSSPSIGAVGPVTNSCSNSQQISVPYKSTDSMIEFADAYNHSDPSKWEERLKLVGYCMLMKKSIVDEIGPLDERFTPGNFEDDDYSQRLRVAGYQLFLCKDTFIHHYGSTSFKDNVQAYVDLIMKNRQKFIDKWGYDPHAGLTKWSQLVDLIDFDRNQAINVLEIGSHCGETLLSVKAKYPHAVLYGIEPHEVEAANCSPFAHITVAGLERLGGLFEEDFFDVILIGENFHEVMDRDNMKAVLRYLRQNGQLLALVPNVMHHENFRRFIMGTITRSHLKAFTYSEIEQYMGQEGFEQVSIQLMKTSSIGQEDTIYHTWRAYDSSVPIEFFETKFFLVNAKVKGANDELGTLLQGLAAQENTEYFIRKLQAFDSDTVISYIESRYTDAPMLLNHVGIRFLEAKEKDHVLPYLQRAFELDPTNPGTIFNLGMAMYTFGHNELALEWWDQLPEKDEQIVRWMESIRKDIHEKRSMSARMGRLLRRVEFEIDAEESVGELLELIKPDQEELLSQVFDQLDRRVIHKEKVLNALAGAAYDNRLPDLALSVFYKVLTLNPRDQDTLFNIGYILFEKGQSNEALAYIQRIEKPGQHVMNLLDLIQGRQN